MAAAGMMSAALYAETIAYPPTPRGSVVEYIFGQSIADPYRWLEGDVRSDAKVRDWVNAEEATTDAYLATLPSRDVIRARLERIWNFERESPPVKRGDRYFFTRNSGLQNQAPLYIREGRSGLARILLDPNKWSADGATALAEWQPSSDGTRLLYSVQDGGSDWRTIRVLDVATGKPLPDEIRWSRIAPPMWSDNGAGFYYERFPQPRASQMHQAVSRDDRIYFHRLGTPVTQDRLLFATPDHPDWIHTFDRTEDGRWLVIFSSSSILRYQVSLVDLSHSDAKPRTLFAGLRNDWKLAGAQGDTLFFLTDKGASRYRLVSIDVGAAQPTLRQVIAEDRFPLQDAHLIGGRIAASYLVDAKSEIRLFEMDGRPAGAVQLPGIGTVGSFMDKTAFIGRADDPEAFFSFTSFNRPPTIYRFNARTGESEAYFTPRVAFRPDDYVIEERFYASLDGTKIPLFLFYRKGTDIARGAPTLLYGYGGFGVPVTPGFLGFNAANLTWVDMGGVYAQVSIRGGSEYGEAWHEAGRLANKQHVFDDFAAAGRYLVDQGITPRDGLAIHASSNGGLLVGAVVNQHPELFAAAIEGVGVLDMLRFNRFGAGRYWVDEYGDPGKEADWKVLRAYSPYHNIRLGVAYPAMIGITADNDDRVVPAHTFKYVAALQHAAIGPKPRLLKVETRAGHGSGKPAAKAIAEAVDNLSFLGKWTGLTADSRAH